MCYHKDFLDSDIFVYIHKRMLETNYKNDLMIEVSLVGEILRTHTRPRPLVKQYGLNV